MGDRLLRAMTTDGLYRVAIASTTNTVLEGVRRHGGSAVSARALARALTATGLLAVTEKEFHRIAVQWRGRGVLRSVQADLRPGGGLRGYVGAATAAARTVPEGLGPGLIGVIEQSVDGRFTQGTRELTTSEIDEDLQDFLTHSEQVPSVLRVFLSLDDHGRPAAAAGLLVQPLPGGVGAMLLKEDGPLAAEALSRSLDPRLPLIELLAAALPGVDVQLLSEENLGWRCECSLERVERGVTMLGAQELLDMIAEGEPARVRCEFCAEDYVVGVERLCELHDEIAPAAD